MYNYIQMVSGKFRQAFCGLWENIKQIQTPENPKTMKNTKNCLLQIFEMSQMWNKNTGSTTSLGKCQIILVFKKSQLTVFLL